MAVSFKCRYFTEAALDVFNCQDVLFNDTLLEHNRGTGIDRATYRGNSGGVTFSYNMPGNITHQNLQVFNSIFRNNCALAAPTFHASSQAITTKVFTGRGGSMAIITRNSISIAIRNCTYENNFAQIHGGGLYLAILEGISTSCSHKDIVIERTQFASNIAGIGGGGIVMFTPALKIVDCNITNNSASAGGGIFAYHSDRRK